MTDMLSAAKGSQRDAEFLSNVMTEIIRARTKFPVQSALITIVALQEEVGELAEAYLDHAIIANEYKKGKTLKDIHKEALQVAVMAMRVALDCDLG